MIYSLSGRLVHTEPALMVIECGGVGYACRTTYNTLSAVGEIGSEVTVFTVMSVRQDAVELFGFADNEELSCFKMLTTVTGVGAKAALSILSDNTPERFAMLVASGDSKALTRSPGIGNKIAQRIVLELKDKIAKETSVGTSSGSGSALPSASAVGNNASEAISALVVLGFTASEASRAIASLPPETSVEDMIKHGLKALASL